MKKKYTVFVSSTQRDLVEERARVVEAVLRVGHIPVAMEYFPATANNSWSLITQLIDDSDYVVCLLAARYGHVPIGERKSYTEKEYDYAVARRKPIVAFIHGDIDSIPNRNHEDSHEGRERLAAFRAKITDDRTGLNVVFWKSMEDLLGAVSPSLLHLFSTSPAVGWVRANTQDPQHDASGTRPFPGSIDRSPKNEEQWRILKEAFRVYEDDDTAWLIPEANGPRKDLRWLKQHGYLEFDRNDNGFRMTIDGWDYMGSHHRQVSTTSHPSEAEATIPGLDVVSTAALRHICAKMEAENNYYLLAENGEEYLLDLDGCDRDAAETIVEELSEIGYIEAEEFLSGPRRWSHFSVTPSGYFQYARLFMRGFPSLLDSCGDEILKGDERGEYARSNSVAEKFSANPLTVRQIFLYLGNVGLIKTGDLGSSVFAHSPSWRLKKGKPLSSLI